MTETYRNFGVCNRRSFLAALLAAAADLAFPAVVGESTADVSSENGLHSTAGTAGGLAEPLNLFLEQIASLETERGNKTALVVLLGQGLEWKDPEGGFYDDPFPQRTVNKFLQSMAGILDTTPEELNADQRVIILNPEGEPDSEFITGNVINYNPEAGNVADLMMEIQQQLMANQEVGNLVVLTDAHGGDGRIFLSKAGISYEFFNQWLAGFEGIGVTSFQEACYSGGVLMPFYSLEASNSAESAQGFLHPQLLRITSTANNSESGVGEFGDFSFPLASEVLMEELEKGTTYQAAFQRAGERTFAVWEELGHVQRSFMRVTVGGQVSRIAGPDNPYYAYPLPGVELGYFDDWVDSNSLRVSLARNGDQVTLNNLAEVTSTLVLSPTGEVVTLGPLQSMSLNKTIWGVSDQKGFKAVSAQRPEVSDSACVVFDVHAAQPQFVARANLMFDIVLPIPLANTCNKPVEVQIVFPARSSLGGSGLENVETVEMTLATVTLPPMSVSYFPVTVNYTTYDSMKRKQTGLPFMLSRKDATIRDDVIKGPFEGSFRPFKAHLPLVVN
jgi:hypothetical protein